MSRKEEILHKLSTEDRNYIKEKLKAKDQKISELEHRLSNCIEPKFKKGDYFIEYWDKTPSIYQYQGENHFKCLNKEQGYHCDYIILGALLLDKDFIKQITEEEAKAKLRSLQNDSDRT